MLKIEYVKHQKSSGKLFSLLKKNSLDFCSYTITLFGMTFRIKYSSKFNYFYIVEQLKRERLMLDALSTSFVNHIIQETTKKQLTDLVRLNALGACSDYFLRGRLDGQDVFIKVVLTRVRTDADTGSSMQNEYEKGLLASAECRYFLKPLYHIQTSPCEILITPFIQNVRLLKNILNSPTPAPKWLRAQIVEVADFLKSKRLVHRDIHGANLVVGNLEHGKPQLFLNDCSFMTFLDDSGNYIPTPIEADVRKVKNDAGMNDELCFANILKLLDEKLAEDADKREKPLD